MEWTIPHGISFRSENQWLIEQKNVSFKGVVCDSYLISRSAGCPFCVWALKINAVSIKGDTNRVVQTEPNDTIMLCSCTGQVIARGCVQMKAERARGMLTWSLWRSTGGRGLFVWVLSSSIADLTFKQILFQSQDCIPR